MDEKKYIEVESFEDDINCHINETEQWDDLELSNDYIDGYVAALKWVLLLISEECEENWKFNKALEWIWEHCGDLDNYIRALKYIGYTQDETQKHLIAELSKEYTRTIEWIYTDI